MGAGWVSLCITEYGATGNPLGQAETKSRLRNLFATIFVDGHKFRANQLLRASGTPCQSMDTCFFHATLRSPSSLLFQSLACGVPTLIGTTDAIPELGNACAFIDSKRGITDREYLNRVLDFLKQLLVDPPEIDRLSKEGRKLAESFSADAISAQFIDLVHALTQRQIETQAMSTYSSLPNLFCYNYDSNHGSVRSQVLQFPHYSSESIEVALAKEFLKSHSRLQAETLLTEICNGDRETVSHILNTLSDSIL